MLSMCFQCSSIHQDWLRCASYGSGNQPMQRKKNNGFCNFYYNFVSKTYPNHPNPQNPGKSKPDPSKSIKIYKNPRRVLPKQQWQAKSVVVLVHYRTMVTKPSIFVMFWSQNEFATGSTGSAGNGPRPAGQTLGSSRRGPG